MNSSTCRVRVPAVLVAVHEVGRAENVLDTPALKETSPGTPTHDPAPRLRLSLVRLPQIMMSMPAREAHHVDALLAPIRDQRGDLRGLVATLERRAVRAAPRAVAVVQAAQRHGVPRLGDGDVRLDPHPAALALRRLRPLHRPRLQPIAETGDILPLFRAVTVVVAGGAVAVVVGTDTDFHDLFQGLASLAHRGELCPRLAELRPAPPRLGGPAEPPAWPLRGQAPPAPRPGAPLPRLGGPDRAPGGAHRRAHARTTPRGPRRPCDASPHPRPPPTARAQEPRSGRPGRGVPGC